MVILTTDSYPGKEITEVKGLVKGSTIRCKNVGRDIGSAFKNLVGGEMVSYKEMLDEAREVAMQRMIEEAEKLGANAIVCFRMMSSSVAQGAAEMVAYGTAVVVE
ncbi:hypothetical protein BH721_08590 [Clostridium baratii]|uniref:UPF0145 protein ERS852568_02329 n=1 Tax=Clostridium baratii TaxID=1561 RepID=A0A174UNS3_9CLOT|nr:YbjQ family protein [Clostridium baratii]OPF53048.1 hypothetical protein A1M12_00740 [Clostridium baratii]OPF53731.1 hypothetical protein BH721_08590 [Clostridium baratii]OPF54419.1 hypothetical protein BH724_02540 [Clostridium baratii]OPF60891.1 hypothetical protein BH725_01210 [Clostridium baratii]CUQ20619.1 Domain of uncharacterised function (DUF74) [Clostridium baratii]